MELLFQNKTTMDKNTCRAFMAMTWAKQAGAMRIVWLVIAAVVAVLSVLQLVYNGWALNTIFFIALTVAALFFAFFGYLIRLPRYISEEKERWGADTLDKEIDFYSDTLMQKTKFGELSFDNGQITKIQFRKNIAVIYFDSMAILLDMNGFTKGDPSEFKQHIREIVKKKK